jgi:hypothetical protein
MGGPAGLDDPTILGPESKLRHEIHSAGYALLSFVLVFAVWQWFPSWERRTGDANTVRIMKWVMLAIAFVSVATATLPRRVLWERFDVVDFRGQRMYIVASSNDALLLYDPRSADGSRTVVAEDNPDLNRTSMRLRLFDQASAD